MNWKTTIASSLVVAGLALVMDAAPARAVDGVLYEVTEDVKLAGSTLSFKSSSAKLVGRVNAGTAICPYWLADGLKVHGCTVTVSAVGRADERTGVGPVTGSFQVVAQDWNTADAPEIVVMTASMQGTIDLSPTLNGQPLGSIRGTYNAIGQPSTIASGFHQGGAFTGTFRLPFKTDANTFYLADSGPVPVRPEEYSLGVAAVKLELSISAK